MMLSEQTVEKDAVARREDTLEVHSSFLRKFRFDRDAAAESAFLFEDISERYCVLGARAGVPGWGAFVEKPDTKAP